MVVEQRRRSNVGILVAVLVLAAIVVGVVVLLTRDDSPSVRGDVAVQGCQADGGKPTATGTILNHSSKTSNYVIRMNFKDGSGNQVSEGVNAVNDVEAGASAQWTLTGTRAARGPVNCEVTGVTRTHIPGQ
jgi:hypothetical protein